MISRIFNRSKDHLFLQFIILLLVVSVVYIYLNHMQETYKTAQWSGERCLSELASVKYQLSVVTEYKNRIDKMLTESQKAHESDKERFKDIMESCVAMKQQSAICQSQFEDLQTECKKVREEYDKIISNPAKLKVARYQVFHYNKSTLKLYVSNFENLYMKSISLYQGCPKCGPEAVWGLIV